ncbi:MAG: ribonuclease P protein component [Salinivirgaceae bacterium]|nr:ribonuclease P protein component [Salinivirgaceae bacterium]
MEQVNHPYSYKRGEHLKLRKAIEMVFAQNNVLRSGPIKLIFAVEPAETFSYQVGFVAPKKIHHFAVDRNRNKRLMREAFRLNKHILTSRMGNKTAELSFLLVAQNSRPMSFADVESAVRQLLARLSEKVGAEGADL